ncbi:DUF3846 domain-containing protein [Fibrella forsythiae]|uniref:DUF3846 domain-containing protein n=1 Tax=Fibrella forsythiae TaxID=2817061 RepID=A0ABS3JLI9_9BACT|nr:hypothetical protein [Fibrella forsythiae]MBO0950869.1 hypothetical protein [Fibrella forsythiae]
MKAILIDVTAQTVTDIDLQPGLTAMYRVINCHSVTRVPLNSINDLWLDDDGLLHDPQPPKFQFVGSDNIFAGNGLICNYTAEGETVSVTIRADQIRPLIKFLGDVHVEPEVFVTSW